MTPLKFPVSTKPNNLAWEPNISSRSNQTYLKINPGTVNYILPSNWQDEFILQSDKVVYVKLKITSSSSANGWIITGCEYKVDVVAPKASEPKKDTPPTSIELLVGIFFKGEYKMVFSNPIFLYPIIFYTTPKASPQTGEESFDKYYIWQHA